MPSLIPGFDNDIFISYRQNDNKVISASGTEDGWVTEFVNHLSNELETFVKSKVNIYFDKNPHDGLLETHNVDETLSLRLKTLIFIPIISRTYCDPESFAWQHEFLAFNRLAALDKFGTSVKLLNGNVSSRILPIRIHELEAGDVQMLEAEMKAKLRPIDFIFKSPGVNRPLRSKEDDPLKNANRTLYRDQINKAANAVKEIISGLKHQETPAVKEKVKTSVSRIQPPEFGKSIASSKSIAVLPFVNKDPGPETAFLGEGLAEEILSSLTQIKSYKVINRSTSFQTGVTVTQAHETLEKMGANMVVEGSLQVHANKVQVTAQVNQIRNNLALWSAHYECTKAELFSLHQKIVLDLSEQLSVVVKEGEQKAIKKIASSNEMAVELYWKGRHYWHKRGNDLIKSLQCFQEAVVLDPAFAQAHAGIANAYVLLGYYNLVAFEESMQKSKLAAMQALELDASLLEAYLSLAFNSLCYEWNWPEAEHNFIKVFAINPHNPPALKRYKLCLTQIKCNFEEAEAEPLGGIPYFLHAYALLHRGKFEEALAAARKAGDRDPNSFMAQRALGLSYLGLGHEKEALETLNTAAQLSNRHPWLLFDLIGTYATMANNEEAQAIMEEAFARANALPAKINNFFFPPPPGE